MRNGMRQKFLLAGSLACAVCIGLSGCRKDVKGTYADASGNYVLDVKSGSDATLSFFGKSMACAYAVSGDILALDCHGQSGKVAFTIHDDGSLSGPPGTAIPALRKTKS